MPAHIRDTSPVTDAVGIELKITTVNMSYRIPVKICHASSCLYSHDSRNTIIFADVRYRDSSPVYCSRTPTERATAEITADAQEHNRYSFSRKPLTRISMLEKEITMLLRRSIFKMHYFYQTPARSTFRPPPFIPAKAYLAPPENAKDKAMIRPRAA